MAKIFESVPASIPSNPESHIHRVNDLVKTRLEQNRLEQSILKQNRVKSKCWIWFINDADKSIDFFHFFSSLSFTKKKSRTQKSMNSDYEERFKGEPFDGFSRQGRKKANFCRENHEREKRKDFSATRTDVKPTSPEFESDTKHKWL